MLRMQSLFLGALLSCGSVIAFAADPVEVTEPAAAEENQHFLTVEEMQRTQEYKPAKGAVVNRWLSDKLTAANYLQLIIDPVVYHPAATPTAQASQQTLDQIATYLTTKQTAKLGSKLKVVDAAAPGTLRLSTAITGVAIKTQGMKAYEVMPIAAVFGAAKAASGNRKQDVTLFIESRIVDAVSGELLAVSMREVDGKALKGKKDTLSVEDVAPAFDAAMSGALDMLSERGF